MKFRYVIETINSNGSAETTEQEVEKSDILLGRGTSCDILLLGRLVSLEHARLYEQGDNKIVIEDKDSLSGVLVNGSLVQQHVLKKGDKVKLGSFSFTVTYEKGIWGFLEKRRITEEDDDLDAFVAKQHERMQFQTYLPSFTLISTTLCVGVFALFLVGPMLNMNRGAWDSGPISNAHKMIENDCTACHSKAFRRVQDEQCLACHKLSDHSDNISLVFKNHADLNLRCAECHMEHNGEQGIVVEDSQLCSDCHGQIAKVLPNPGIPNIASLGTHPEFRVTFAAVPEDPELQSPRRVSLAKKDELNDTTPIKLNHKIHLQADLAGADGLTTLGCGDCHQFSRDFVDIKPINFEEHCASCHPLEFDERLPGRSVPHGEPDTVYNYLFAEYAKLFLAKEGKDTEAKDIFRARKPGKKVSREEELIFARGSVESVSRSMEESLFKRTACHLCHNVTERIEAEVVSAVTSGVGGSSKFKIVPPNIPVRWMPASTFDHGAHQEIACESCHGGVKDSEVTADVLLPGIDNCKQCHEQENTKGMVVSDCVTCHSYHQPLLLDEDRKREIEKVLLSFDWSSSELEQKLKIGN